MVEEIHFSPLRVVELDQHKHSRASILSWLEVQSMTLNEVAIARGKHSAAYSGYSTAQTFLLQDCTATSILSRALKGLRNLTRIGIYPSNRFIGANELIGAFGMLRGDELIYDCSNTLQPFFEALYSARVVWKELSFEIDHPFYSHYNADERCNPCPTHPSQPRAMLPALDGSGSRNRTLSIAAFFTAFSSFAAHWTPRKWWKLTGNLQALSFKNLNFNTDDELNINHAVNSCRSFTDCLEDGMLQAFTYEKSEQVPPIFIWQLIKYW